MLSKHGQENIPLHSSGRLSELNQECQGGIALHPIAILLLSAAILKHMINNGKVNLPMKKLRHDARKNASMTAYTKQQKAASIGPPSRSFQAGLDKKKPAATYFPALAVSSAQRCLTSVFGMGTGIATSPWPPAFITMPLLQGSGPSAGLLQALCTVFLWNTSLFPQGEAVIWPSLSDY